MYFKEFWGNRGNIEGETPQEILNSKRFRNICDHAAQIGEWGSKPQGPHPIIRIKDNTEVAKALTFDRLTRGYTDVTIDYAGEFCYIASPIYRPREIIVASKNPPEHIKLDEKSWKIELANAIIQACENPGKYVDYELGGRQEDLWYPEFE